MAQDIDKTFLALKYPGYHTWRNLNDAIRNSGRWPNGDLVRITDPELQPSMDAFSERIKHDKRFRENLLGIKKD